MSQSLRGSRWIPTCLHTSWRTILAVASMAVALLVARTGAAQTGCTLPPPQACPSTCSSCISPTFRLRAPTTRPATFSRVRSATAVTRLWVESAASEARPTHASTAHTCNRAFAPRATPGTSGRIASRAPAVSIATGMGRATTGMTAMATARAARELQRAGVPVLAMEHVQRTTVTLDLPRWELAPATRAGRASTAATAGPTTICPRGAASTVWRPKRAMATGPATSLEPALATPASPARPAARATPTTTGIRNARIAMPPQHVRAPVHLRPDRAVSLR